MVRIGKHPLNYNETAQPKPQSRANKPLTGTSQNKLKRSVKIKFALILIILFCVSLSFGLVHHFFRYSWAGEIFYYTALLFVAIMLAELFLIIITR